MARLVVAFLGCMGSCLDLAVLCSCSIGVWLPPELGRLVGPLQPKRLFPKAAQLRRTVQELDKPGQACSSFSGLQAFSQGLAVFGAAPQ